jgi:hypothetical protein
MVRDIQREVMSPSDLTPDRAAELLVMLTALIANIAEEIRYADHTYAAVLLACLDSETKANRARIRAEISPEYQRKREARDTKELVVELVRSLKYFLRSKEEEMRLTR